MAGELIRILDRSEDGWWTGEKDGIRGHFPSMLVAELGEEEEDEDEEEDEEEEDEDEGREDGAFDEVTPESGGSTGSPPVVSGPPPTFAPPKPINLVPQQIVIMQPTPEIESKGTFGDGLEAGEDVVSTDDGIGDDNSENEANETKDQSKKKSEQQKNQVSTSHISSE